MSFERLLQLTFCTELCVCCILAQTPELEPEEAKRMPYSIKLAGGDDVSQSEGEGVTWNQFSKDVKDISSLFDFLEQ